MIYENLRGKNVLITGASSDIGVEIARKFALEGANLGLHYLNNSQRIDELLKEFGISVKTNAYKEDFTQEKISLVHNFVKDFGSIDVLVNNAGLLDGVSFFDMTTEQYDKMFKINSRAPYLISKDAFEYMKKNKFGRIINISSISVKFGRGRNNSIQYAGSKATLDVLTKGLSILGAKDNILVNSVRPSVIMTKSQKEREDLQKRIYLIPLKRCGKPSEVADLVVYLASEKANFITGQVVDISGGE